ncbi:hypothetical protein ALC56_14388, partial [Trachymyrmex septentrionalis]
ERSGGGDPGMKKNDVEGVRSTLSYLASATPPIDRPTLGPDLRARNSRTHIGDHRAKH